MTRPEDFERLGDLLGDACDAAAPPAPSSPSAATRPSPATEVRTDQARAVALAWPEVVGDEVAANASPVRLKNGRLTVSTSSSAWADTLGYMSSDLIGRLNERLGSEVVDQMIFRHAGWEERSPHGSPEGHGRVGRSAASGPVAEGALSAEQEEALASVEELDLPPDIREKMTRAMRASFARKDGDSVR